MKARNTTNTAPSSFTTPSIEYEATKILAALKTVESWDINDRCVHLIESLETLTKADLLLSGRVNIAQKKYAAGQLSKDEAIRVLDDVLTRMQQMYPGHISLSKLADSES